MVYCVILCYYDLRGVIFVKVGKRRRFMTLSWSVHNCLLIHLTESFLRVEFLAAGLTDVGKSSFVQMAIKVSKHKTSFNNLRLPVILKSHKILKAAKPIIDIH